MKASRFYLFILFMMCIGFAQAKFYIGIEGGYTGATAVANGMGAYYGRPHPDSWEYNFKDMVFSSQSDTLKIEPFGGMNFGINFGAEEFYLDDYLGIRWGLGLGYSSLSQFVQITTADAISSTEEVFEFLDTSLSLDMMINLWREDDDYAVGIFGGIQGEYHYLISGSFRSHLKALDSFTYKDLSSFSLDGRLGLSVLIAEHHRVEFLSKLPILVAGDNKTYPVSVLSKISLNVGYKYLF